MPIRPPSVAARLPAGAFPGRPAGARRFRRRVAAAVAVALGGLVGAAGCRWSTQSSLPEHIRTVSVPMFGNPTTEYGVETRLTAALRRAVLQDNRLRLVNGGADAELSGDIVRVQRRSVRDNRDDRPATMQLTVYATYSFRDAQAGRFLVQDAEINSNEASSGRGLYQVNRDPRRTPDEAALDQAIDALAAEIIRRTLNMW